MYLRHITPGDANMLKNKKGKKKITTWYNTFTGANTYRHFTYLGAKATRLSNHSSYVCALLTMVSNDSFYV
jgi:hypothetical protein